MPGHIRRDAPALIWDDGRRTYAELRENALAVAKGLAGKGLAGKRVAFLLHNRGEIVEPVFACAYAGVTLVPVNFRLTPREIAHIFKDAGVELVVTDRLLSDLAQAACAAASGVEVFVLDADQTHPWGELQGQGPLPGPFETLEPLIIAYTSGTTGTPKGVVMHHKHLIDWVTTASFTYPGMVEPSVLLAPVPFYNIAGFGEALGPLAAGGAVGMTRTTATTPELIADYIHRWRTTEIILLPHLLKPLARLADEGKIDFAHVRMAATGGANVDPDAVVAFRRAFPWIRLIIAYGLAEGGILSFIGGDELARYPGAVGRAAPGHIFKVLNKEGALAVAGEVGEVVRPPQIAEYWNAPALTAAAFEEEWFRTGDLGRLDEEGQLYIVGRLKDLIISKGQSIYPAEIENALAEHPSIADVAVIGVPDREAGEAVCAAIVAKQGHTIDEEEVIAFSRAKIASYKKPKYVVFLNELPRNLTGKVVKHELAAAIGDLETSRGPR